MRCAVIRGADLDLTVLIDALRQVGATEVLVLGNPFGDTRLFDPLPDFVIGLLSPRPTDEHRPGFSDLDVMLRVGMSVQRGLPTLLIAPPTTQILSSTAGLTVAYSTIDNAEALPFHLSALTAQVNEKERSRPESASRDSNSTAEGISQFLGNDPQLDGIEFETLLRNLIQSAGARAISSQPGVAGDDVDLVAMLPDTASGVILVQAKTGTIAEDQKRRMEADLSVLVSEHRASLGLLVYYSNRDDDIGPSSSPLVLTGSFKGLARQLATHSLAELLSDAVATPGVGSQ
jgi:hypothetical protein